MPNLNSLILTGSDYKVAMNVTGINVFMLQTVEEISWNDSAENELIYAVGNEYAIGNKQNSYKFSGKLSMQNGEMHNILQQIGLPSAVLLPNVILSVISLAGGPATTYTGMCINTAAVSIKRKDKESIISLDWTAINIL